MVEDGLWYRETKRAALIRTGLTMKEDLETDMKKTEFLDVIYWSMQDENGLPLKIMTRPGPSYLHYNVQCRKCQ